jgi:hypothetical protein
MISTNNDLKIFLNDIIIDLDNNSLSEQNLFTLGEFFLLWKFNNINNLVNDNNPKDPIKFYILGWYIYTFLLNKNN